MSRSHARLPLVLLLWAAGNPVTLAREDPSALCLDAAAGAARATGVPYDVLLAISVVETGRDDRPWPWTVNIGGDGHWFDTRAEAESHARVVLDQGITNLDVGCFQLNLRWHAQAFGSLEEMMDPALNAGYAAEFLASRYAETGDWAAAAAAYHSATPEHAERYRARFEAVYAGLDARAAPAPTLEGERVNGFPLLVAGAAAANGSLVPLSDGGSPLIGGD